MKSWPDDKAHCDRADCPKAFQCIRHQALIAKRRRGIRSLIVVNDFTPDNCSDYVEA